MYCTYSEDVHGPAVLMPVWLGEMQIVEGRFREVEPWLIVLGYKGLVLRYIVGPREAQLLLNILTRNLTPSFLVTEQLYTHPCVFVYMSEVCPLFCVSP